ncbi:hypothetical protein QCA50_011417 [Cerrena zonata]|uniref:Uncharacterized protein n=1 Tax=Cerrena zonata TaxID=2478898 RepID=A0AAW0G352_9APHY
MIQPDPSDSNGKEYECPTVGNTKYVFPFKLIKQSSSLSPYVDRNPSYPSLSFLAFSFLSDILNYKFLARALLVGISHRRYFLIVKTAISMCQQDRLRLLPWTSPLQRRAHPDYNTGY